ncbi:FAD-binding domain-containing protein [Mollisia scopiformis]|uniref:FAD-binding domain-containing protein n=1 Tax=Mollisia scopiformis TaxID=149040 RepID=A0A194XBK5_MOLSC|nr:FAD-binding domain-containing protein [Mollisia scopiformis]KUJ17541.1 FAD-binding domain-containing protein [Mollisia scopiformis]
MGQFLKLAIAFQFLFSIISGLELFNFEKSQLTPRDILTQSDQNASLLKFAERDDPPPLNTTCKVFPGDALWPSDAQWALLNSTTDGALIKTIPLASPCYPGPLSNTDQCSYLTANWANSSIHMVDPTSPMSPIWQGRTCEPPTLAPTLNGTCTLGGLPSYSINATTVSHIQAGINFARNTGIRLVIKNTGHDFSGKSSGAGSLNIWTHYLKDIAFTANYAGDAYGNYSGPAFKAGSGVQAWEIYEAAEKEGVTVVGGEGRTVGVMGGYILGGGHSPLSSIYGIAADSILSLNLVLASGEFVTASPTSNPTLFWALRGGGGSTFGVVTSVTIKAYPPLPVTTFSLAFPPNITTTDFWNGVRSYLTFFPSFTAAGTYGYFFIFPSSPDSTPTFLLSPFFAPNLSIPQTQSLLTPSLPFPLPITYTHHATYLPAWTASFPQEPVSRSSGYFGSRLFPCSNFLSPNSTLFNATFSAIKTSVEAGYSLISFQIRGAVHPSNDPDSAVNPAWREAAMHSIQTNVWNATGDIAALEVEARQSLNGRMEEWKAVTPGSGAYLGESDRGETGWQTSFYGAETYGRLVGVKRGVDPGEVFWAKTAVGSEGWEVRSGDPVGNEDGRLCRV